MGVCLSSNNNSHKGHGEGQSSELRPNSNSSSMAISTMVHRPSGSVSRGPSKTSSNRQTTETDRKEHVSHKSRSSQSSCMEITKQNLTEQGFSGDVADRILGPQRPSTRRVYSYRWQKFADWCEGREEDPLKASIPLIAEFLSYLFLEESKKPGTIDGYKTAIADVLQFHSKENVFGNTHLAKLVKSFYKDTPRQSNIIPKWDLSLVLRYLMGQPFEPMKSASLKYVTWKTAFLVCLASASRCSEIHALSYNSLKFQEKYLWVEVEPIPEFKAKTANRDGKSQRDEILKIPALAPVVGHDLPQDRSLCPVRALKIYRARTEDIRKHKTFRKLFISYKPGFEKDIQLITFSSWLRCLIREAYFKATNSTITMSSVRPHEIRALSSSVAWKSNIPISEIMRACQWRNHTTFTDHYLRDISMMQDELHSLGKMVVAQTVTSL